MSLTVRDILGASTALGDTLKQHPEILKEMRRGMGVVTNVVPFDDLMAALRPAMDAVLELDIPDLLIKAWEQAGVLEEYADPAQHDPNEIHLVPLSEHEVRSSHEPSIVVSYGGMKIESMTLSLELEVALIIESLQVVIRKGRALEMRSGQLRARVKATRGETVLLEKESENYDLPTDGIPLGKNGEGIPLIPEDEFAAAAS